MDIVDNMEKPVTAAPGDKPVERPTGPGTEWPGESRPTPTPEEKRAAVATRGRILSLLAYLLSQPAIKCTMLRTIRFVLTLSSVPC